MKIATLQMKLVVVDISAGRALVKSRRATIGTAVSQLDKADFEIVCRSLLEKIFPVRGSRLKV